MAVDIMRSCYTAQMRFYRDSDDEIPVDWYFVPDDREYIRIEHSFMSRLYERTEEKVPPLGERYKPVPWRGGTVPHIVGTSGFCGSKDQWQNGSLIAEPLPDVWPGTTLSKCCGKPKIRRVGGIAMGHYHMNPVINPKGGMGGGGAIQAHWVDVNDCLVETLMPMAMQVRWIFIDGPDNALNGLVLPLYPGNPLAYPQDVFYTSLEFAYSPEFPYWQFPTHAILYCLTTSIGMSFGLDLNSHISVTSSDPLVMEGEFIFLDPGNGGAQYSRYLLSFTPITL